MKISFLVGFFLALAVQGCTANQLSAVTASSAPSRLRLLQEVAEKFNRSVYWSDMQALTELLSPEAAPDALEKTLVTAPINYTVEKITPRDEVSAEVSVIFASIDPNTRAVQAVRKRQLWEFRRLEGGWFYRDLLHSEAATGVDPLRVGRPGS